MVELLPVCWPGVYFLGSNQKIIGLIVNMPAGGMQVRILRSKIFEFLFEKSVMLSINNL
jgi:hypothetical protein